MKKLIIILIIILSWNFVHCQDEEYNFKKIEITFERDKKTKIKIPSKLIDLDLLQLIEMPKGNPNGSKLTVIVDHNPKKTNFSSLDIGYEITSRGDIRIRKELNLYKDIEVNGNTLFNLYPYRPNRNRFILEDVYFKISYFRIDGKIVNKLPKNIKLKIIASSPDKDFQILSNHLLDKGVIPNRTAFNLLFQHNPILFDKKGLNVKKIKETSLEVLKPSIDISLAKSVLMNESRLHPKKQNKNNELETLSKKWTVVTKKIKKRHYRNDHKKKKKQIKRIEGLLSDIIDEKFEISDETLNLLMSDCSLILLLFEKVTQTKKAMLPKQWSILNSLISDIGSIAKAIEAYKFDITFNESKQSFYNSLVTTDEPTEFLFNTREDYHYKYSSIHPLDTYLFIVSTFNNDTCPYSEKSGLEIKAMPLNHKRYKELYPNEYSENFGSDFIKSFNGKSTPTYQYMPPGKWYLWAELTDVKGRQIKFYESEVELEYAARNLDSSKTSIKIKNEIGDKNFYKCERRYLSTIILN